MKLVYFGNKLSKHGRSKSGLETLEPLFGEFCQVESYSDKNNQYHRLIDMFYHFFANGLRSDIIMIDVFSTNSFYFAYFLGWLSYLFSKPYILFLRGGNLPARYKNSNKKIDQVFKRAKAIVAPSGYLQSFFEGKGFTVNLIPNIIDIKKFPFERRQLTSPRLLYLRGFEETYNPQMTVLTVKQLIHQYPDIQLAMLGSATDDSLLETKKLIKQLQLEENIIILGNKTQEEWVKLSKEYNVMVSNPVIDNTPMSVIQAMALGLLVVSTDVGGVSFLVENKKDGILVESNDHKGMADAIHLLFSDHLLSCKMQENARLKAESFSWENIRPKWESLLTEIGIKYG